MSKQNKLCGLGGLYYNEILKGYMAVKNVAIFPHLHVCPSFKISLAITSVKGVKYWSQNA